MNKKTGIKVINRLIARGEVFSAFVACEEFNLPKSVVTNAIQKKLENGEEYYRKWA